MTIFPISITAVGLVRGISPRMQLRSMTHTVLKKAKNLNLNRFVAENSHLLRPPVGNHMMFDGMELKVMIVGGPNQRDDYHIEKGEELFYQLKGGMDLNIKDMNGETHQIHIGEGEMFLLPACIPHSPQRYPDTIGIVVERTRLSHELDSLRWYVPSKNQMLYEEIFHCKNLGTQVKEAIEKFSLTEEFRTKVPSRVQNSKVKEGYFTPKKCIDFQKMNSFRLKEAMDDGINGKEGRTTLLNADEFRLDLFFGGSKASHDENVSKKCSDASEKFFWQKSGKSLIRVMDEGSSTPLDITLNEGDVCLLNPGSGTSFDVYQECRNDQLLYLRNAAFL